MGQPPRCTAEASPHPRESVLRAGGPAELAFVEPYGFEKEASSLWGDGGYLPPPPGTSPDPQKRPLSHPGSLPRVPVRGQARLDPGQEEEGAGPSHRPGTPPRLRASKTFWGKPELWRLESLQGSNFTIFPDPPKSWASRRLPGEGEIPREHIPTPGDNPPMATPGDSDQADPDPPPAATHRTGQCPKAAGPTWGTDRVAAQPKWRASLRRGLELDRHPTPFQC